MLLTTTALGYQKLQNYFHGLPFYDWWRVLLNAEDQPNGILAYDNTQEEGYMLDMLTALFESLIVVEQPLSLAFLMLMHQKSTQSRKLTESGCFRQQAVFFGCAVSKEGLEEIHAHLRTHND